MVSPRLEFYNFTLTFGENRVLVDMLEEVVIPAFFGSRTRDIRSSRLFFDNVSLVHLGDAESQQGEVGLMPAIGISGRFIKDTELKSEQRYDYNKRKMIKDERQIQSSPSAIFVLTLNNHRFIYLRESSFSPNIKSFEATIKSFIQQSHIDFLSSLYDPNEGIRFSELESEYPHPNLEISPLSSRASLREFISQYSKLEMLEVKVTITNAIDDGPFFDEMRRRRGAIGASNTSIKHQNKEIGLDKEEAISQTEDLVEQSNTELKFSGLDHESNRLTGNLERLKLIVPMEITFESVENAAQRMYEKYSELIQQGAIAPARIVTVPGSQKS